MTEFKHTLAKPTAAESACLTSIIEKNITHFLQTRVTHINKPGHCLACGTKLRVIGTSRKNGTTYPDWDQRKYHRKCV
jgi:hypothetical protein